MQKNSDERVNSLRNVLNTGHRAEQVFFCLSHTAAAALAADKGKKKSLNLEQALWGHTHSIAEHNCLN